MRKTETETNGGVERKTETESETNGGVKREKNRDRERDKWRGKEREKTETERDPLVSFMVTGQNILHVKMFPLPQS